MKTNELMRQTASVCPVCHKRIPAGLMRRETGVYLEKQCPEHGGFSALVWRERIPMEDWIKDEPQLEMGVDSRCPSACGLCAEHKRGTCCLLMEITGRCNLNCPHCFAQNRISREPTLEELTKIFRELGGPEGPLVQLSGGEPTCREDLEQVIRAARAAGVRYVQLNSNGIRLGREAGYAQRLKEAGLSFVFMQFDGLSDDVYAALRGEQLLQIKEKAIENCARAGLGVTLVPMLVPGVNTHQIGGLIRFGLAQSPAVRGIHFQPVSYFSKGAAAPDQERYTLDELIWDVEEQTGGMIRRDQLSPSCCDHPRCGFHGDFMVGPEGLVQLSKPAKNCCCQPGQNTAPHVKNRRFVARRWERPQGITAPRSIGTMEEFLARVKTHGFTLTAMAFMDEGTLDLERLQKCSLHVYDRGNFVPFCAHYLGLGKRI